MEALAGVAQESTLIQAGRTTLVARPRSFMPLPLPALHGIHTSTRRAQLLSMTKRALAVFGADVKDVLTVVTDRPTDRPTDRSADRPIGRSAIRLSTDLL